jgi:soluble lytic murein transglycosylase-like protein
VVRVDRRSGRLIRTVVAKPGSGATAGAAVAGMVEGSAKRHQVDPLLVHSVIRAESNYNAFAISPKGAQGLMQLMPATARRWGVNNSFDPAENLEGGVRYLRYLLDLFGDEKLAVAAYNAGEQAVIRYGGVPPYPETANYVRQVSSGYASAKQSAAPAAATADTPPEPEFRPIEQFFDERGNVYLRTR